jgi:hypothetical protein
MNSDVFQKAMYSGISGAGAMTIQVGSLMWLRTIMNYQYKYGGTINDTCKVLYKEGGIPRFYRGLLPALAQGPLSRFGDTFSNSLVLAFCTNSEYAKQLPIWTQTMGASVCAGLFRSLLMPIDTLKTLMQVEGSKSFHILKNKMNTGGIGVLFNGTVATASATMLGHYPWFITNNYLNFYLPKYDEPYKNLCRNAFIGFSSSIMSDTISNSLRVLKTYKQTHSENVNYITALKEIIHKDGYLSLFNRGLKVRLFTNGIQGLLFNVLWKMLDK